MIAAAVRLGARSVERHWTSRKRPTSSSSSPTGASSIPRSGFGLYLVRHWERVLAPQNGESLVYWLRKLVFRGAWLDHRVKEGLLDVVVDRTTPATSGTREPARRADTSRARTRPLRGTSCSTGASDVLEPDSASRAPDSPGVPGSAFGPHALQILTTEHWSLLAARSLVYTESMSRASIFVAALSGSVSRSRSSRRRVTSGPASSHSRSCCFRSSTSWVA